MSNPEIYEQILNKKFEISPFTGYSPEDVDNFFDLIIDYLKQNEIEVKTIKSLNETIKKEQEALKKQMIAKDNEINMLKAEIQKLRADGYSNITNKNKLQEALSKKGEK